jgi:hypothetical protein
MIVVNVGKVIERGLDSGEGPEHVMDRLGETARDFIHRYFSTYKRDHGLPDDLSYDEFKRLVLRGDKKLKKDYLESRQMHVAGYLGEIAVHYLLSVDWHKVFEFNDVYSAHMPDGYIGVEAAREASQTQPPKSYNVKTRYKNTWGLTVYSSTLQEDFYVSAHYHARHALINLIGYVTRAELEVHELNRGHFWTPLGELHPIEYFTPLKVLDSLKHYCGDRWDVVSQTLP